MVPSHLYMCSHQISGSSFLGSCAMKILNYHLIAWLSHVYMKEEHRIILIYVSINFCDWSFGEICDLTFTIYHLIGWLKAHYQIWDIFLATESPLKMMKNAFYLTSKALFTPKIQWNLPIADIANRGHAMNSGQNI